MNQPTKTEKCCQFCSEGGDYEIRKCNVCPCHTNKETEKDWRQAFDDEFKWRKSSPRLDANGFRKVKSFIQHTLTEEKKKWGQELLAAIKKNICNHENDTYTSCPCIDEIQSIITQSIEK